MLGQVTSQTKILPPFHQTREVPSGLLPSDLQVQRAKDGKQSLQIQIHGVPLSPARSLVFSETTSGVEGGWVENTTRDTHVFLPVNFN